MEIPISIHFLEGPNVFIFATKKMINFFLGGGGNAQQNCRWNFWDSHVFFRGVQLISGIALFDTYNMSTFLCF